MNFRQDISTFSLLLAATGGIVGSGWLLGPFYTAQVAGPAAVVSWCLGGLLMMVIALTFAELATAFPVAGGMVRFAHFSHGKLTSFTMAWISWLAAIMVAPIETMAALQYASNYIPNLFVEHSISGFGLVCATVLMYSMCLVNFFAVKYFAKSNSVIVLWKLAIPIITIFILLSHKFNANNFTAVDGFAPMGLKGIVTALPTAGVIFSFIGYSPAIQLAAEAKNPQRAIPTAILGAISIAIILYACIEIAFIGAVDPSTIQNGWQHISFAGDTGPIAGIIAALGITWFLKVIYFDALVSPLGTAYIYTASTARINVAMSANGYMPELMKKLNQHGSPSRAILLNFICGMLFFLPFPGWQQMVSFLVSCFVFAYAIGPIACASLRKTMPDVHRPFRLPMYQVICLLAFYICNLIILWTGWTVVWKMLLTTALGYIVLIVQRQRQLDLAKAVWLIPYLAGTGIISYCGDFGGIGIMPFGYDFIVLALFSAAVFYLAIRCSE